MERDFRLTGVFREQSDTVQAPLGFDGKDDVPGFRFESADKFYSQQQVEGS